MIVDFIECVKRQEGVLSEVPGMEERARDLGMLRAPAEEHYGLGDNP